MNEVTEFSSLATLSNMRRLKNGTVTAVISFFDETESRRAWKIFDEAALEVKVTRLESQPMVVNLHGDTYE
jgi:hypothetical protein